MTANYAQQAQSRRDLRTQLSGLDNSDSKEILFEEWSPGRTMMTLWSTIDGMEITIPRYMVDNALKKPHPTTPGKFLFTAFKEQAPEFRGGTVKCFLAEGSPERETGLLSGAGLDHLVPCKATELRSPYSKEQHAKNRHPSSWSSFQHYVETKQREETRDDQRKQTEAMMAMAGKLAPVPTKASAATVINIADDMADNK
jgi:hypothetical protein